MTREQAKELLPIIQAFTDGKNVQEFCEIEEKWEDVGDNPREFRHSRKYRIKPEPREWECILSHAEYLIDERVAGNNGIKTVRVREILD